MIHSFGIICLRQSSKNNEVRQSLNSDMKSINLKGNYYIENL